MSEQLTYNPPQTIKEMYGEQLEDVHVDVRYKGYFLACIKVKVALTTINAYNFLGPAS